MSNGLKRLLWMSLLGAAAYVAWILTAARRRSATVDVAPSAVSPAALRGHADLARTDSEPAASMPTRGAASESGWQPPVEGACPAGYPIKANDNSGIYHVPGGRFYDRTRPERCYATPEAAEADGYRRSKS